MGPGGGGIYFQGQRSPPQVWESSRVKADVLSSLYLVTDAPEVLVTAATTAPHAPKVPQASPRGAGTPAPASTPQHTDLFRPGLRPQNRGPRLRPAGQGPPHKTRAPVSPGRAGTTPLRLPPQDRDSGPPVLGKERSDTPQLADLTPQGGETVGASAAGKPRPDGHRSHFRRPVEPARAAGGA